MNSINNRVGIGLGRLPFLETPQLILRMLAPEEAGLMVAFRIENRAYLLPWEPARPPEFFTPGYWSTHLRYNLQAFREGHSVAFSVLNTTETEVLGVINFTSIIRGTFQACYLGYALAEKHQGKGIMTQALLPAVDYMFTDLGLHRIMAAYLPRNRRSADVLSRLGFRIDGQAEKFMKINGVWEDHVLTSLVNPAD